MVYFQKLKVSGKASPQDKVCGMLRPRSPLDSSLINGAVSFLRTERENGCHVL